ncbi:MAG: hypothetical protein JSW25_10385 [Thermoplasmata archaeon]|nr:MAG: hypothetical protein JSW25_10385 [Thermoplasmata archaeon]
MRARTLLSLSVVLIMVLASSGCLSVDAVRDLLLLQREDPEVVYWKVTPSPVDEFWEADSLFPADTYSTTATFKVKDGAKWIKVSHVIELPSAVIGDQLPLNLSIVFEPEVTLRLRMPNNDIYWERNFTTTDSGTITIPSPMSGIWTLRIEARGHGVEAGGAQYRDTLRVTVDLYEPK